jgi:hypothetical protein
MKTLIALLLFALPLAAETPREIYPSDYKPLLCAAKDVCKTYDRVDFARWAGAHRKLPIRQEWVDKHWDELSAAFAPICRKIANCLASPGNTDWVFCTDFMRGDFLATADRFEKGTDDYDQWLMSSLMWYHGLDNAIMAGQKEAKACLDAQPPSEGRTLEVWTKPATIGPDYNGNLIVYALDAETRIPVMAAITIEGQTLKPANDSPNGHATSYYKFPWPITLNEVPNADGHHDVVSPKVFVQSPAYKTATFTMPIEIPKAIVEMQPPVSQLKRGPNTVTVVVKDAVTGKPVEMRVMGGDRILGDANKPFTLELKPGTKRPEIWVTSMFHRYSDVVVAKAE